MWADALLASTGMLCMWRIQWVHRYLVRTGGSAVSVPICSLISRLWWGKNTGLELNKGILDSGSVVGHCAIDQIHRLLQEAVKTTIGYSWCYMTLIPALWSLRLRIAISSSETLPMGKGKKDPTCTWVFCVVSNRLWSWAPVLKSWIRVHRGKPRQELKPARQEQMQKPWRMLVTVLLPWVAQPAFLQLQVSPVQVVPPTVGWAFASESLRKHSPGLPTAQS